MVIMGHQRRFEILYSPAFKQHLKSINSQFCSTIKEAIEEQLFLEPDQETRNRKPIKRPVDFEATWEIRCGSQNRFRVFDEVDHENKRVLVLAVGEKIGNRLFIGGEEIEL